jgi:electron transfer flavoprotein beta subunit
VVLSIGPGRVSESLRKALAMGCDRAIHIHDDESWKKDPYQIASMIHSQVSNENFDLIFTGMQSQDRGSAQVGVLLAGMLEIACSTTAIGFELKDHTVTIRRELEGGMKSIVNMKLPALVTCQLGLNRPRYPTLPNIMKAKKKELKTVSVDEMNVPATMSLTKQIYTPARKGSGQVLDGDVKVSATRLVEILKEKTTVLR